MHAQPTSDQAARLSAPSFFAHAVRMHAHAGGWRLCDETGWAAVAEAMRSSEVGVEAAVESGALAIRTKQEPQEGATL